MIYMTMDEWYPVYSVTLPEYGSETDATYEQWITANIYYTLMQEGNEYLAKLWHNENPPA